MSRIDDLLAPLNGQQFNALDESEIMTFISLTEEEIAGLAHYRNLNNHRTILHRLVGSHPKSDQVNVFFEKVAALMVEMKESVFSPANILISNLPTRLTFYLLGNKNHDIVKRFLEIASALELRFLFTNKEGITNYLEKIRDPRLLAREKSTLQALGIVPLEKTPEKTVMHDFNTEHMKTATTSRSSPAASSAASAIGSQQRLNRIDEAMHDLDKQEVEIARKKNVLLHAQLKTAAEKIFLLETNLQVANEKSTHVQYALQEKTQSETKLSHQLRVQTEEIGLVNRRLQQANEENLVLKQDRDRLSRENDLLRNQLLHTMPSEGVDEAKRELLKAKEDIAVLSLSKELVKRENERLVTQIEHITAQNTHNLEKMAQLERSLTEQSMVQTQLEQELKNAHAAHASVQTNLEQELKHVQKEQASVQGRLEQELKGTQEAHAVIKARLEQEIKRAQEERTSLIREFSSLNQQTAAFLQRQQPIAAPTLPLPQPILAPTVTPVSVKTRIANGKPSATVSQAEEMDADEKAVLSIEGAVLKGSRGMYVARTYATRKTTAAMNTGIAQSAAASSSQQEKPSTAKNRNGFLNKAAAATETKKRPLLAGKRGAKVRKLTKNDIASNFHDESEDDAKSTSSSSSDSSKSSSHSLGTSTPTPSDDSYSSEDSRASYKP